MQEKNVKLIAEKLAKHYGQVKYWKTKERTKEMRMQQIMKWLCQIYQLKCQRSPELKEIYKLEAIVAFRNELKKYGYKFNKDEIL